MSISAQSVHFPDSFELSTDEHFAELVPPKTVDEAVDSINSTKKRDLTDWSLAEHYDSKILVQVCTNKIMIIIIIIIFGQVFQ